MSICERGQECSCWFDGLMDKRWADCCTTHDNDYINNPLGLTKEQADKRLYECVARKSWKWMAMLMYAAVKYSPMAKNYWNGYRKKDNG